MLEIECHVGAALAALGVGALPAVQHSGVQFPAQDSRPSGRGRQKKPRGPAERVHYQLGLTNCGLIGNFRDISHQKSQVVVQGGGAEHWAVSKGQPRPGRLGLATKTAEGGDLAAEEPARPGVYGKFEDAKDGGGVLHVGPLGTDKERGEVVHDAALLRGAELATVAENFEAERPLEVHVLGQKTGGLDEGE